MFIVYGGNELLLLVLSNW